MEFKNLKEVITYLKEVNKGNYYLDYMLEEQLISKEWYEEILKKVKDYKPKRVIDVGSNLNMFGFMFANEEIEYIGIDISKTLIPITSKKIKFIHSNYYDVREKFKNDVIISCLCVGYLIPIKDVLGKVLIIDDIEEKENKSKCIARIINIGGNKNASK